MKNKNILNVNLLKIILYSLIDFYPRVINKIQRVKGFPYSNSSYEVNSDSEATKYRDSVISACENISEFKKFRRNYNYREILEHVTFNQGKKYCETIIDSNLGSRIEGLLKFAADEKVGNPRKFYYPGIGKISPTMLRYISVAVQISNLFSENTFESVVEIGVGYGGQAAILSQLKPIKNYYGYDLPEVLELSNKYLNHVRAPLNITPMDITNIKKMKSDFVISNFAFSELSREVQEVYLEKILSNAAGGYMLMNSGTTNFTGRSTGKMNLEEIKSRLPNCKISSEKVESGPDNYLITWLA